MNLIILGYIMEGIMRNYQVGILTVLLYASFLIALGMTGGIHSYEGKKIPKPVVIFEPLSNLEGEEFDEKRFVSDLVCYAETIKALDRQNIKTHANNVSTKSTIHAKTNNETSKYTKEEINLLENVAYLEAGNQGLLGMRLVVDVILNRVESPAFPNNVHDVIFQPGQFSTARKIDENANTVSNTVKQAVQMELGISSQTDRSRLDPESLYFARKPITQKGLYQVGDHYFSR